MPATRWTRVLVVTAAATAVLAGACSDGDEEAESQPAGDATAIRSGGEMVYALEAESSGGFCLTDAQLAISGMMVVRSIYDPLTVPTAAGGYAPYLLESVEPNETATSFDLRLREGITFHDGTPLDSTVLKNNLDAWLGRYPNRTSLFLPLILANVDTVEIVDDMTVEVTTKIPWPAFPGYLNGGGRLGVMAQAQLDDPTDCDKNLIGTGPFVFDGWRVNEELSADRNPDYWATDDDGNRLPYLDRIVFVPVPDAQTRVNGLLSGEFDAIMTSGATATETLETEEGRGAVELTQTSTDAEVNSLMFNESKPPFDDRGAREAAIRALDRDTYRDVVALGLTESASGPFPPGAPGHLDDAGFPEYDLERAKELVADYEQRTGAPLEFSYLHTPDPDNTQAAQFNKQQFEAAGMDVNLQAREQATLISEALGTGWNMLTLRNFPGGTPDGNYAWWYSNSPVNFPRMTDPEIDSMLDSARSELDEDTAVGIYEDINRRLNDESHFLWLDWVRWTVATRPGISGVIGPTLPSGDEPTLGMSTGHPTLGLHHSE